MKRKHSLSAALRLCLFLLLVSAAATAAAPPPNIVLIFIDDMGYGDIGPFGNTANKTPHLDRMAVEGNVLRQFYVANTACTPSRAALMTGTYAHRIGMDGPVLFPGERRGLNPAEITIAEMLKEKGYATGHFGKWHLGDQPPFLPLKQGFDDYFGIPYSNDMWPGNKRGNPVTKGGPYVPLPVIRGDKPVAYVSDGADQSLLCEVVTDEAVAFIRKHRDGPFFCYVPHAYVHSPRYARPEIMARAGGNVNRANIEEVDDSVGRILDTLRELELARHTFVLFTSDNGGDGGLCMGPLRGNKVSAKYEGHMRVPTITWWPGTIPAGTGTDAIAVTTDLLPSFAKLAGAKVPADRIIDGRNVLDILLGKPGARSPHEIHHYENEGIRHGDWKLVRVRKGFELYDLAANPGETNDLADQHPDLVEELRELLAAHAKQIAAVTRPAAFVEDARPILTEPGDLPRLRDYVKKPHTRAANEDIPTKAAP
ncbi:sulfatase-like hydrolase/transferase [Haloferula sp. A504]|uniref:sulfatase-like hydrolase/transferase n=1 Tax=Haloferula sp. A504 TaxID=3373601 RepID=UPI0031C78353|nr:sulfatase-like hydrolase/transferase [Verrucomicrobiaceae bacterium E54]